MATTPLKDWPVNGFVVKDWTGIQPNAEPVVMVIGTGDIFEFIAEASAQKRQIAIYPVGHCVLNWTNQQQV